jgi:hypothetical protein
LAEIHCGAWRGSVAHWMRVQAAEASLARTDCHVSRQEEH